MFSPCLNCVITRIATMSGIASSFKTQDMDCLCNPVASSKVFSLPSIIQKSGRMTQLFYPQVRKINDWLERKKHRLFAYLLNELRSYDKVVKSRKKQMIVIPAPFCNGVNSSPAFSGIISHNYENTGHRFSPVRRLFTKPSYMKLRN
jgi:hypothetical protein